MRLDSVLVAAGAFVHRCELLIFTTVIALAYSIAEPPETTFGSAGLEHVKDLLACAFAFCGLVFRALIASVDRARRNFRLQLTIANLIIVFGIFLMHGNHYVILFGLAALVFIYGSTKRLADSGNLAGGAPNLAAARRRSGWPKASVLAKEWLTVALTIGILLLTEVYEYMPDSAVDKTRLALLFVSGLLTACGALLLCGERRGKQRPAMRDSGQQTRGIRVDGRVGSVDILENVLSLGSLDSILRTTLEAADLGPGERLVDIGCGSGKLAIAAAALFPDGDAVEALGIDATPGMIDAARERARKARSRANFQVGVAETLPLPDGCADAVTSSFFFHHLPSDVKHEALREMWRVLAPGGRLVITDYARPRGFHGFVASFPMRFNVYEYVRGQLNGELERMISAEGLGEPELMRAFLGYISVLRIVKPCA